MAAPIWITPKGNLGTIEEQEFYELVLESYVPDDSKPNLEYTVISGNLPPGLVLSSTGVLLGRPKDEYVFRGVPFDVSEDVTSTFCVRVTNTRTNQVADRTFQITVTGQDAPTIITESKELGSTFDGQRATFSVTAIDLDREPIYYYVTRGSLPPGLSLNSNTGVISGITERTDLLPANRINAGWSPESIGWDEEIWDHSSRAVSKRFEFDITVTDNKEAVTRTYYIYVISKDALTADNDAIVVSGYYDNITADQDTKRIPIVKTPSGSIGIATHKNYFAYQFEGLDFDGDDLGFSLFGSETTGFDNEPDGFDTSMFDYSISGALPPGLVLNTDTGWLYGNIPDAGAAQIEYQFGIKVYKKNYPDYQSDFVVFSLTVVGDLRYVISWNTSPSLGEIKTGEQSELEISASNALGKILTYSLTSNSRLPQGLRLLENGLIAGRPSFEITSFDQDTTRYIDQRYSESETTFDRNYSFTVKASDVEGLIEAYRTFTITLKKASFEPYEAVYLRAMPGLADKEIYNQIVYSSDLIPNEFLYRNGDPYFGRQRNMQLLLLSGIKPGTDIEYRQAMQINHYRKKIFLGAAQIASAVDENGIPKYEVLYLPIIEDNASANKSINLRNKIQHYEYVDSGDITVDTTYINNDHADGKIVYPNSLSAMRMQIRNTLGMIGPEVLPLWMKTKQENGRIPYWTPAVVLAYLQPGTAKQVKFYFDKLLPYDLKNISFECDRYVWDCNMSTNFNASTDNYLDSNLTSFDEDLNFDQTQFFEFTSNGSTTLNVGFVLGNGLVEVKVSRTATIGGNPVQIQDNLVEGTNWTRNGTNIVFKQAPVTGSLIEVAFNPFNVLSVDYAVELPYDKLNNVTRGFIDTEYKGLDSIIDVYEGKTIIFAKQENFPGYNDPYAGWLNNKTVWDEQTWDSDAWDDYVKIPGYFDNLQDESVPNQRAGIWKFVANDRGFLQLEFQRTVALGQLVRVKSGAKYGGRTVIFGPSVESERGFTVPRYTFTADAVDTPPTTFDNQNTRFISNVSIYEEVDQGDKYLAFPRRNIFV